MIEEGVEVAVIGGGTAGLAAAIRAKETGAERITPKKVLLILLRK